MTQIIFVDQLGASRKTIEECRGGLSYVEIDGTVYWPLTEEGNKRLTRACCGQGEFTEPAPDEYAIEHLRQLRADALRYRFIRSGGAFIEPSEGKVYVATAIRYAYYSNPKDMDDAIDAAMESES